MNNEDRIISMLSDLTETVSGIKQRLDKLETGQAVMQADISELKINQAELKAVQAETIHIVKAINEQTQDLVEFEAEMRLNIKSIKGVTKINTFEIAELKAAVNI